MLSGWQRLTYCPSADVVAEIEQRPMISNIITRIGMARLVGWK
jgi:hypothetical protein